MRREFMGLAILTGTLLGNQSWGDEPERPDSAAKVLARKEAELECLQEEIDRLRGNVGRDQSLLLTVVAVEVSCHDLGADAAEFERLFHPEAERGAGGSQEFDFPGNVLEHPLARRLRKRGVLRVFAEPSLVARYGSPASFVSGENAFLKEIAPSGERLIKSVFEGTKVEFVPTLLPEGKVRLQLSIEVGRLDRKTIVPIDVSGFPLHRSFAVRTETTLPLGKTISVGGMRSSRIATPASASDLAPLNPEDQQVADDVMTLLLVRAQVFRPTASVPPAEIVPISADDELIRLLTPSFLPDDMQYFPATAVPRKGTLR